MRYFVFAFLFFSCSTLKNPYTQNVKSFAKATRGISFSPGELYKNLSDYRHELRTIESATLFSTDKVMPRLNAILDTKRAFEKNAQQINNACLLVGSYAECLLSLVDEDYYKSVRTETIELSLQLATALSAYNKNFKKNIPLNAGDFLGFVVNKLGSVKMKQLQKKYLKEFINNGDLIITDVCDYFTNEMALSLENEMSSLDKQFDNVMSNFYDNIEQYQRKQDVNPFDYLKNYNPIYLTLKEKLNNLHYMEAAIMAAMKKIKSTHTLLKVSIDNKIFPQLTQEVKELYAITQEIKTVYLKL